MSVTIKPERPADGLAPIRTALQVSEDLHADLFKRGWNQVVRLGLDSVGQWWRDERLRLRFTVFAERELDYEVTERTQREKASFYSLVTTFKTPWGPARWLPSKGLARGQRGGRKGQPVLIDQQWRRPWAGYFRLIKQGKIRKNTVEARKAFAREVRRDLWIAYRQALEEEANNLAIQPLVHRGQLRQAALAGARWKATVTQSTWRLKLTVPRPHPVGGTAGDVMRQLTSDEVNTAGRIVRDRIEALVSQASSTTSRTGRVSKRLTDAQKASAPRQAPGRSARSIPIRSGIR